MFRFLRLRKARAKAEDVSEATEPSRTPTGESAHEADQAFDLEHAEPLHLPLDGVLDLHTFRPEDASDVVREYVLACQEAGVLALRIIHGKGKGTLRRTVHATLERMPDVVANYRLSERMRGGWGATLVDLRALSAVSTARAERGDGQ